jgi:hypothetical protein
VQIMVAEAREERHKRERDRAGGGGRRGIQNGAGGLRPLLADQFLLTSSGRRGTAGARPAARLDGCTLTGSGGGVSSAGGLGRPRLAVVGGFVAGAAPAQRGAGVVGRRAAVVDAVGGLAGTVEQEVVPPGPCHTVTQGQSNSHTAAQLHSDTVTQSHSCTATQSHSCTAAQRHSHTVTQLHSDTVTQLHSHTVTR